MKKAILVVAVLMLAAPAWGVVMITCEAKGPEVTVSYDMNDVNGLIRAVALDITVDNSAVIKSVYGYHVGESNEVSTGYGIFPGSIDINATTGDVCDYGTPVRDPCEYPGITLDGVNTPGVTVEMGSLYYPVTPESPNAPGSSGVLLKFTVDCDCNVSIAENAAGGGVVMEDGSSAATNLPDSPCAVVCACPGDLDKNGFVMTSDMGQLIGRLGAKGPPYIIPKGDPLWNDCGDIDGNGFIMTSDLGQLIGKLGAAGPPYIITCPCP
jgi:hypothetical protein